MTVVINGAVFPLGPLAGEFYDNGRKLVLLRPFRFVDGAVDVTVPELATTDFNSTPRLVWSFFPPWEHPEAGTVHDWGYRNNPGGHTQAYWDGVHRRIMELTGASKLKREAAYRGLRLFGGGTWNRYRAKEQV